MTTPLKYDKPVKIVWQVILTLIAVSIWHKLQYNQSIEFKNALEHNKSDISHFIHIKSSSVTQPVLKE